MAEEMARAVEDMPSVLKSRCNPERLARVVDEFSDVQLAKAREIGFGLIMRQMCGSIDKTLCRWMATKFDQPSRSFDIFGSRVRLEANIVRQLLGIPDGEMDVFVPVSGVDLRRLRVRFQSDAHGISTKTLEEVIRENRSGGDLFKQALVMLL